MEVRSAWLPLLEEELVLILLLPEVVVVIVLVLLSEYGPISPAGVPASVESEPSAGGGVAAPFESGEVSVPGSGGDVVTGAIDALS